jgi:hypothetical protein
MTIAPTSVDAIGNSARLDSLLQYTQEKDKDGQFNALLSMLTHGKEQESSQPRLGVAASILDIGGLSSGNLGALLGLNDTTDMGLFPASLENRDTLESIIGSSGPLPNFLREVVTRRGLDAAQTQSLYDITARNMDIVKSPESVQRLAEELTAAGIA